MARRSQDSGLQVNASAPHNNWGCTTARFCAFSELIATSSPQGFQKSYGSFMTVVRNGGSSTYWDQYMTMAFAQLTYRDEPARYRKNVSAVRDRQALSSRVSRQGCACYFGRRQRISRLPDLCPTSHACLDWDRPTALLPTLHRRRSGSSLRSWTQPPSICA